MHLQLKCIRILNFIYKANQAKYKIRKSISTYYYTVIWKMNRTHTYEVVSLFLALS